MKDDWVIHTQVVSADSLLLTWQRPSDSRPQMDDRLPALIQNFLNRLQDDCAPGTFVNLVAAYATLWVQYRPAVTSAQALIKTIESLSQTAVSQNTTATKEHLIEIPVCYDPAFGWDLEALANTKHTSVEALVAQHTAQTYRVHAVGFSPGFAYLGQLPESLAVLRHPAPRADVPAGSVALADRQTAIYPINTPAGWQIIGRTPLDLSLNDPSNLDRFQVGDRVRFRPISRETYDQWPRECKDAPLNDEATVTTNRIGLTVQRNAFGASIQDEGRLGWQSKGLAPSGAMDKGAFYAANRLLAQPLHYAALEIPMGGCELKAETTLYAVVTGADLDFRINDVPHPRYQPFVVQPGDRLSWTHPRQGLFAYLGVWGGWQTPKWFDSRSVTLREQIGQALKTGDALAIAPQDPGPITTQELPPGCMMQNTTSPLVLRFIPGFQWRDFDHAARQAFLNQAFQVSSQSGRVATRLQAHLPIEVPYHKMLSEPMADGSIQIPPSGEPIAMQADRPTIGGYPKVGALLPQDLYRLAQAQPGSMVRFQSITPIAAALKHQNWQQFWASVPEPPSK
ncbi:carboxyltransferase domain-containing protein [Thiomicrospira sp. WB1]|uniref:5-oxoprolinase subunit B/C family protein n=1 Tax=Thiomicrospira sp. WB1 TaxID=1685380 RepID=UPI0007469BD7|nr:carboxyltransferase domain-containing protein [Thiomicrospira sp. WB1]KUJ71999.1 hypothetical protein AVO41_06010 [Thiomicrospira sp. WB1]